MYDISWRPLRGRLFWSICFAAMAMMSWGCGQSDPKYWPVSGKVTFRGKPVTTASIRFSNPQAGVDVVAKLDPTSKYDITGEKRGLPEGTYQVAVVPILNFDNIKQTPGGLVLPSSMPSMNRPDIPTRYHDPSTSGLTMTVKPEPNTYDVDMQSAK